MSIRIGSNYIAGSGGGSVDTDDISITTNTNHEIQSIGNVNKNTATGATAVKYDWIGTLAEFNQQDVANTHPEWICYVTDDVAGGESVYTKEEVDEMIKCRRIGEIIQSTIPLTDAGLHLLDGSVISGSGAYSAFVTYIAGLVSNYPDLFETEANWQQSVTNYGVCGKFVYDSTNNTIRLPKITGFTEGTIDPTVLGDLVEAGLPNIEGEYGFGTDINTTSSGAAKMSLNTGSGRYISSGGTGFYEAGIDTSGGNSIYGNSTTVQPQSIKVLYYIVIATSTKTQIEVDIDEVMTDLNLVSNQYRYDGQWVYSSLTLASGISAPTTVNIEYDLSSYLPNDGYNYTVCIGVSGVTGTTSGNQQRVYLKSQILKEGMSLYQMQTRSSASFRGAGTMMLPIGLNRKFTIGANENNTGTIYVYVYGYRRIGTNS